MLHRDGLTIFPLWQHMAIKTIAKDEQNVYLHNPAENSIFLHVHFKHPVFFKLHT